MSPMGVLTKMERDKLAAMGQRAFWELAQDQTMDVYAEDANGKFTVKVASRIACALRVMGAEADTPAQVRVDLEQMRELRYDPAYAGLTADHQIETQGARWNPRQGTIRPVQGFASEPVYRRAIVEALG